MTGERDGQALAACKDVRIHASAEDISKSLSLQGNWRAEHVFALKQALALFDFIGTQLAECNLEIKAQLHSLQAHDGEPAKGKKRSNARNAPKFDLRTEVFRVCGVSGETKALCQPRIPGATAAAAQHQVGRGCVLPAHVLAHGQARSRDRRRAQAGAADLRDVDEERYRGRELRSLSQRAAKLGIQMVLIAYLNSIAIIYDSPPQLTWAYMGTGLVHHYQECASQSQANSQLRLLWQCHLRDNSDRTLLP